ncbi:hypothetical protein HID58_037134 [Brassica napus]|uniref:QWRF motif-containing protein 4 n=1 Tax=Brassica napus TaxID=3708 RepID=A0ABQ7XG05_BRANA|nr:hypothetical protein HID58_037134 [Brassica napus]
METFYGSKKASMRKQQQQSLTDTTRPPLVPAEKNNAVAASATRGLEQWKAISAERKRSSTPTTPTNPSTPVSDVPVASRRLSTTGQGLWPSTMRSLSVSFQSDSVSVPVSQSENSKPVDGPPHSRLIEQHRWPSRIGGKIISDSMNRSLDLGDKAVRRMSNKPLQKSSSDTARLLSSYESNGSPTSSEDLESRHRLLSASLLDRATSARVHPLSAPGSRTASPSRSSFSSSSSNSRGMSPLRGLSPSRGSCLRSSTPPRGVSPSRIRQSNTCTQSSTTTTTSWRFANARAEGETLYNVWHATSDLRDLVTSQRICLQQMKLETKLDDILNKQMVCLEDWAILEREHVSSLAGAIADLEANTLRLPLTGGTKVDLRSLKLAMSSAFDVMHGMGSSIWSLHSQMEEVTKLVEESSLMTHLMQKKQEEEEMMLSLPLLSLSKFPWPTLNNDL